MCVCVCVFVGVCPLTYSYFCTKCLVLTGVCVCFSSGGADRQQRVRLHPPGGPRRDGGAAGNQATPAGRGWLSHRPRERFQLCIHLLPGWYPRTRYCYSKKAERNIINVFFLYILPTSHRTQIQMKVVVEQVLIFSHPQQLHPVLILLPMSRPSVAFLSA